jgi:hypothetical protein
MKKPPGSDLSVPHHDYFAPPAERRPDFPAPTDYESRSNLMTHDLLQTIPASRCDLRMGLLETAR